MTVRCVNVVGAVAILMVGAVACPKDDSSIAPTAPTGGSVAAKVMIDGQPKPVDAICL
ncbi:hypothetical protein [Mycobacterium sp. RTGN5]|uniref:hypothetical protein n=1 Tax=Mycobacterium sp. RTGN5 TaxID=3016522 RepID=UPI0029C83109|nr:hypothetical protein [Mycobacterium sp. RTGN5]